LLSSSISRSVVVNSRCRLFATSFACILRLLAAKSPSGGVYPERVRGRPAP
jgi:hypothetical protein